MLRTTYKAALLCVALAATACARQEPNYCPTARNHNCLELDAALPVIDADADLSCRGDQDCEGATPVCDLDGTRACVQCTTSKPAACVSTTPVCNADNTCRRCSDHADCASRVCLPDGSCATEASVAYVAPGGSSSECSLAAPCPTLDAALKRTLPFVKVAAGLVKDNKTTTIDGQAVTIFADRGATLDRDGDGPILQIQSDGADVKIFDLVIKGATGGAGGDGIDLTPNGGSPKLSITRVTIGDNQGLGLSASGGSLAITQSTVSGNDGGGVSVSGGSLTLSQSTISENRGGGVSATGTNTTFDITNNIVTYNGVATGSGATQVGGLSLLPNTLGSRFERNTVAFNKCNGAIFRGGVTCVGEMVSALGNIVYGNTEGAVTSNGTQLSGSCVFGNSLALGSVAGDLGFKSPVTDPLDFHLTANSPASVVDAAGPCAGTDFDGDARPVGNACDLGADERKP